MLFLGVCMSEVDMSCWTGRRDPGGPKAERWHQRIQPWQPSVAPGVVLLGFCCDEGVVRNHGRAGAATGPLTIRHTLAGMPCWLDRPMYDAGNVCCVEGDLETCQRQMAEQGTQILNDGHFLLAMGGGHEIAYASFHALADHLVQQGERVPRIGLINLDAHLDARPASRANSGTSFRQIAKDCQTRGWPFHYCCVGAARSANTMSIFEETLALGGSWILDETVVPWRLEPVKAQLQAFMERVDHIYLTIDLDVLPAMQAPGVSAPAARGVALEAIEMLIDDIRCSEKLRLADIAELNPAYDKDLLTARVAARLIYRLTANLVI